MNTVITAVNILQRITDPGGGGDVIPSNALLWDDGSPVLWDDNSYIIWE